MQTVTFIIYEGTNTATTVNSYITTYGWSRKYLVYIFLRFARISYGRLLAIRYRFKQSKYIQDPLMIGRRGCVQWEMWPLSTVRPLYRTGDSLLSRKLFLYILSINIFHYLMFAWPGIIDINNIDDQLDATITAN